MPAKAQPKNAAKPQIKADKAQRRSIGARRNPDSETAILKAARQILAQRGYGGFSIDEVARRAGAGKPTIYRWWPTKAHLLAAVLMADKKARVEAPDTSSLAGDLAAFAEALLGMWRDGPAGTARRALIAEAQTGGPAAEAFQALLNAEQDALLTPIFTRAIGRGELDETDSQLARDLWLGWLWARLLTGRLDAMPDEIARMAERVAGISAGQSADANATHRRTISPAAEPAAKSLAAKKKPVPPSPKVPPAQAPQQPKAEQLALL